MTHERGLLPTGHLWLAHVAVALVAVVALATGCTDVQSAVGATDGDATTVASQDRVDRFQPRLTVVLWDVTGSFRARSASVQAVIVSILGSLGPGDELVVATIAAPSFSPARDVRVRCRMPEVPKAILQASRKLHDWKRKRLRLAAIWVQVDAQAKALAGVLAEPFERTTVGGTDVHGALAYAAHRLAGSEWRERRLVLLSDLVHEEGGGKTSMPPSEVLPLAGVHVIGLGVPWDDSRWAGMERAWRAFVERSGGVSFTMFDASRMLDRPALPPSVVPRDLPPSALLAGG